MLNKTLTKNKGYYLICKLPAKRKVLILEHYEF